MGVFLCLTCYKQDCAYATNRYLRDRKHVFFYCAVGLEGSSVRVIPDTIAPSSLVCQGAWSAFNITWQPSVEVNHGHVKYEVGVQAEGATKHMQVG